MHEHKRRARITISPQATDTLIWFNLRRHFYEHAPVESVVFRTAERSLVPNRTQFILQLSAAFRQTNDLE